MHFSFLTAALMAAVVAAAPEAQYGGYQKCDPEVQYVTRTETVPEYVTTTQYQVHTQYQTQYQPHYVTHTEQVPQYVTHTQTVPEYITQTVLTTSPGRSTTSSTSQITKPCTQPQEAVILNVLQLYLTISSKKCYGGHRDRRSLSSYRSPSANQSKAGVDADTAANVI
ncbi:uncharacterized protein LOC122243179 [Penaeus japonicus]|uniref:uncharacterized protein LOC122243179 n=1 Tax=Penaeus japonicus TaxID=27405 RepID=UPI001C70F2B1|nr:uncharacterized protein LOC122243179 [Penaeus japonicus]